MVKINPVDIYTEAAKVAKRPRVRIQRGVKVTAEEIANNNGSQRAANYARNSIDEKIYSNYLQLANQNGRTRFNSSQTHEISKTLNKYKTEQDKTSLLKEMLSIGTEQGTPLNASEIKGYLHATSGMNKKEQNNVLDFLKMAKEYVEEKKPMSQLKKELPYEKFREQNLGLVKNQSEQSQEYVLHTLYERTLNQKYIQENRPLFMVADRDPKQPLSEMITNGKNLPLVRAIANSDDVDAMFGLVRILGVNETVMHSANSLTDILKLTGNGNIVMDLSTAFYPAEIKQIAQALKTQANKGGLLKKQVEYVGNYDSTKYITKGKKGFLSTTRNEILNELGLSGKVRLISMGSEPGYNKYKH